MAAKNNISRGAQKPADLPQGITELHLAPKMRNPVPNLSALLFFAVILLAALSGAFGGQPHPRLASKTEGATLTVAAPQLIRNGEFFEMRMDFVAHRPIGDATLEISQSYWKDLTINTMIPAPQSEEAIDGKYRFSFGSLQPGARLSVKIDGQINPPLFAGNAGVIALYDGEQRVAAIPVQMKVWP